MTPAEIRAAIAASPALQALGHDTQAIADALSVGRTRSQEVEAWRAKKLLIKAGKWRGIAAAAADPANPATNAAYAAMALAESASMQIDFCDPVSSALMGGLIAAGLITAAERDALVALSTVADPVTHTQVGAALAGSI